MKHATPFDRLSAREDDTGLVNLIVDTPKGSRNKFRYDSNLGLFSTRQTPTSGDGMAAETFNLGASARVVRVEHPTPASVPEGRGVSR